MASQTANDIMAPAPGCLARVWSLLKPAHCPGSVHVYKPALGMPALPALACLPCLSFLSAAGRGEDADLVGSPEQRAGYVFNSPQLGDPIERCNATEEVPASPASGVSRI